MFVKLKIVYLLSDKDFAYLVKQILQRVISCIRQNTHVLHDLLL